MMTPYDFLAGAFLEANFPSTWLLVILFKLIRDSCGFAKRVYLQDC